MLCAGELLRDLPDVPGSAKAAVRIPHSRSVKPLSSSTPRSASSVQAASASSTQIVSWKLAPLPGAATTAGSIRLRAAERSRRLTIVFSNLNATASSSS
jgi:hypothetical protein